jgi:hypothetical protein
MKQKEPQQGSNEDGIKDAHGVDAWGDVQFGLDMHATLEKVLEGSRMALAAGLGQVLRVDRGVWV